MRRKARNSQSSEAWMPPTPIWHSPLMATVIAGVALDVSGPSPGWAVGGAIVGGVALVVGFVDQFKRQRVRPRRLRKPVRVFGFYFFATIVITILLSLWGAVDWPAGFGAQVAVVSGMWLLTTVGFALGVRGTNRLRERWAASSR